MRLQLEDGTIIEVPDDATDEEITAIANEMAPVDDPYRDDVGAIGTSAFRGAVANTLGFPVDMVNAGLDLVGLGTENPIGGSQSIMDLTDTAIYDPMFRLLGHGDWVDQMNERGGISRMEAETQGGRLAARIAEELGAAGATMGLGGALANTGRAGTQALSQTLTEAPVGQMVASGAAGAGAGIANEVAPGDPYAELAGALLGGGVGAAATPLAMAGGSTARSAALPFTEGGRERIVGDTLAEFGGARGDPAARQGLAAQLAGAEAPIPGAPLTTAQAALDPGLSGLHRGLINEGSGQYSRMLDDVMQERAGYRETLMNEIGDPNADPMATGNTIRNQFQQGRDNLSAGVRQAYRGIDPTDISEIPVGETWAGFANALNEYGLLDRAGGVPASLRGVLGRYQGGDQVMSWRQLNADRIALGDIAASASRSGENSVAAAAGQMRQVIDDTMNAAIESGQFSPEQMAQYQMAQAMRRQQGRQFDDAPLGPMLARDFGEYRMPPESIGPTAFRTNRQGGGQAMRQFGDALGGNDQATSALRDHIVTTMAQTGSDAQGAMTANRMAAFTNNFRDAIANAPDGVLAPEHRQAIDAIVQDLALEQTAQNLGRAVGSPTIQNLSIANLLRHVSLGTINPNNQAMQLLGRGLNLIYKGPSQQVQNMLMDAMLDPELASMMLQKATADNLVRFGEVFRGRLGVTPAISGITTSASNQEQPRTLAP